MAKVLAPEHYQGIGEIVVVWAKLEAHVFKVLHTLTRVKLKEALIVYWQMGYRERLTVLHGLIIAYHPNKNDKLRQDFEALVKRMDSAYVTRNVAAHSIWFPGINADQISPFGFNAKGSTLKIEGRGGKCSSFDPQAFHKQALVIDRLAEDFKYFFSTNFKVRFLHKKNDSLN